MVDAPGVAQQRHRQQQEDAVPFLFGGGEHDRRRRGQIGEVRGRLRAPSTQRGAATA